ncbi:MAG TPA: cytochrome c oxidase subunit II [Sphingomonas sp.]|nr:cytochrome c oxidase subunit II [Sphingomonas sp.]
MILPVAASIQASRVDVLFWMMVGTSGAVILLVLALLVFFSVKYRRGTKAKRGALPTAFTREIEIGWTVATFTGFLFMFWWAASVQTAIVPIPKHAMEIHVVAKQWMWKTEHPGGQREINTLHLPVGVPVKLVMTSQDVIHSFFVPAFRLKQDVLPGRYTELNFTPDKVGTFQLFCAEYCGSNHSKMLGGVIVMTRQDYARWLEGQPQTGTLADQGKAVFTRLGCAGCHVGSNTVHAPSLAGIYGTPQPMTGGGFKVADEDYLRDSIMLPGQDVVAGYAPVMPSYQGVASEEDVVKVIAYLKAGGR